MDCGATVTFGAGDPVASKGDCWPCLEAEDAKHKCRPQAGSNQAFQSGTFGVVVSSTNMYGVSEA